MNHSSKQTKKFNQTLFHTLKIFYIERGTSQLVFYVQVKCPIRRPILHFINSHVDTTKIMISTGRKFVTYSCLVSYSLFITYSLFAIPYFIRWISIKLGRIHQQLRMQTSLLIFKFRGQGHGDILSFHIQPSGHNIAFFNWFRSKLVRTLTIQRARSLSYS